MFILKAIMNANNRLLSLGMGWWVGARSTQLGTWTSKTFATLHPASLSLISTTVQLTTMLYRHACFVLPYNLCSKCIQVFMLSEGLTGFLRYFNQTTISSNFSRKLSQYWRSGNFVRLTLFNFDVKNWNDSKFYRKNFPILKVGKIHSAILNF